MTPVTISTREFDAFIFDLDGVITDTAAVHEAAWKILFDQYLAERAEAGSQPQRPFDDSDYRMYVDGRARADGVEGFLRSRGIHLPRGEAADSVSQETAWGVANRKNKLFLRTLARQGVHAFPSSIALIHNLRDRGLATAVVTASRNCVAVLKAAGISDLFDARVDGVDADRLHLPGKPDAAMFLEAARRLRVSPSRAAVAEDAIAGVQAARRGGFKLVVGVDRRGDPDALTAAGADVVVSDLAEIAVVA
ncbi:MAG: beta-phosphoglucomutase family hydrolase [Actinomycetota bacterium]